jgi:hypothetical protein
LVAVEMENLELKMQTYEKLGFCYKSMRQYENSLKCHKKQLELAWRLNNSGEEIKAY